MKLRLLAASAFLLIPAAWAASSSEKIDGLWDATVTVGGTPIPFRIEFSGSGSDVKGWFFNGSDKEISNSGNFDNGNLTLNFESYASVLKATVKDGVLEGEYIQRGRPLVIRAARTPDHPAQGEKGPDIHGIWYLENVASTKKGEKAWNLVVEQKGAETS